MGFEGRGFAEGVADAGDFFAHGAHGRHAEARGALEDLGDFRGGNEAQLGVFSDFGGEAVVADESRGKAGDFAWAEGPRRIDGVGAIDGQGDGALADDENAGDGIAAVEQRGAFAEGNLRSRPALSQLVCELSNFAGRLLDKLSNKPRIKKGLTSWFLSPTTR